MSTKSHFSILYPCLSLGQNWNWLERGEHSYKEAQKYAYCLQTGRAEIIEILKGLLVSFTEVVKTSCCHGVPLERDGDAIQAFRVSLT